MEADKTFQNRNHRPPQYVICVDGGGSSCTAVLVSSTGTVLTGEAGPCNASTIGVAAAISVIASAINAALSGQVDTKAATIASIDIASAWVGMAGYDRPSIASAVDEAVVQLLGLPLGPLLVVGADIDLLSVNAAKHPASHLAIVLVAGTGSVAMSYVQDESNTLFSRTGRVGGWGALLGDEGSGFAIGRAALRVALRTSDALSAGHATVNNTVMPALSKAVYAYFRQQHQGEQNTKAITFDPRNLLSYVLAPTTASSPTKSTAQAARLVVELADTDQQARKILEDGASSLADLVVDLLRQQNMPTADTAFIMAGGLLCNSVYNQMVRAELIKRGVVFPWSTEVNKPALEGAKFLATRIGFTLP